jgi:hypothetical protein
MLSTAAYPGAVFTMHKTADSSARHVWYSPSGNMLKWAVQRVSKLCGAICARTCRLRAEAAWRAEALRDFTRFAHQETVRMHMAHIPECLTQVGPGSAQNAMPPDKNRERSVAVKHIAEVHSGARLFPSQNSNKGALDVPAMGPSLLCWPVMTVCGALQGCSDGATTTAVVQAGWG